MDALSIIVGSMLGGMAGWAFATATMKQREANKLRDEATRAREKEARMKNEFKTHKERSFADTVQGVLFYTLGISIIAVMGMILVTSIG